MSRWDDVRPEWYAVSDTRGLGCSAGYTLYFPSDSMRIWRMLSFDAQGIWTVDDVAELARFTEDFVLCEHVGLPSRLSDLIGPHFIEHFADVEDLPLFDYTKKVEQSMLATLVDNDPTQLSATEWRELHERIDEAARAFAEDLERPESYDALSSILSEALRDLGRETPGTEPAPGGREVPAGERIVAQLTQLAASGFARARSGLIEAGVTADHPRRSEFGNLLAQWTHEQSVPVSPGVLLADAFRDQPPKQAVARSLYEDLSATQRGQFARLETLALRRTIPTPPVLGILLSRCDERSELIPRLVELRAELSPLRDAFREIAAEIEGASTLKEQLDAIEKLEERRRALVLRYSPKPTETLVQRTWNVVKTMNLPAAAARLADLLLAWDKDRSLLGGLRRLVDLKQLSEQCDAHGRDLTRLFGEIR